METKSLLGPIIGDILHTTFCDKHFVYDENKSLLNEKSKISGYTLITLAIAKYIMKYNHLYKGEIDPERSEKRKELLCKTILDLAKDHPELTYPEWLNKWLESGKCTPETVEDGMTIICFSPIIEYFSSVYDLESLLRMIPDAISVVSCVEETLYESKIFSTALYVGSKYDPLYVGSKNDQYNGIVRDFLATLYKFRWPSELEDLELDDDWNTSLSNALVPAMTVFYQGDKKFFKNTQISNINRGISDIRDIGGLGSLVVPLVSTLVQVPSKAWFNKKGIVDGIESYRALLPDDLLEINDNFFEFIMKIYHSERTGDGTFSFVDLLDLL